MWIFALVACKPPTEPPPTEPPPTDTAVQDTAPPVPTADTAPEIPVVDCTFEPGPPFDAQQLEAPRGYHGIAFDQDGRMVGSNGNGLVAATSSTDANLIIPNNGYTEQLEFMDNGDIVASSNGGIWRYAAGGGSTLLASGINAYGLTIGPDGLVYTANNDVIHRIDPNTGTTEVWLDFPPGQSPKVLDFSQDLGTMYVGTLGDQGNVYAVTLDANYDPVGTPTLFGSTQGSWHDGLRVDACGRVYVAEYNTTSLYMLRPNGSSMRLVDYPFDQYGHGISWGSGIGNWDDHTIYVPQPYDGNHVAQLTLGVPYRAWNGGVYERIMPTP